MSLEVHDDCYYAVEIGIEHLAIGFSVKSTRFRDLTYRVVPVENNPTMFTVIADEEFELYYYTSEGLIVLQSTPKEGEFPGPKRIPVRYMQYVAQIVSKAIKDAFDLKSVHDNKRAIPQAVINSMIAAHGVNAPEYIKELRWHGDCWGYTWCGLFVGVEEDGYRHT